MAASDETEITLGTGKMLAIFFALVALCAVFFGMGFSFGRNSVKAVSVPDSPPALGGARPSAIKSSNSAPNASIFYKIVGQNETDSPSPAKSDQSEPASENNAKPDPAAPPPLNGYYVQVAAVTKPEDAQALVEALKKKQYSAFATTIATDKLFHVQVGPFADIKEAEDTRGKLVSDGYNPILKK
jgi:cell division septation protein DedD